MVQLLAPRIRAAAEARDASGEGVAAGVAALEADDPATALAHCGPLAEHMPAGPATLCAAQAAERSDRSEDAIRFYRALLAHNPDHAGALLALARLVGRDGDDAAARALLARCVKAHPDSIEARLNLGVALARLGDLQGARATWSALLERDPKHEEAKTLLRQLEALR
jgi:tetratricopeptide (TPR) repeat protein